jgi:hypothetical protein
MFYIRIVFLIPIAHESSRERKRVGKRELELGLEIKMKIKNVSGNEQSSTVEWTLLKPQRPGF